MKIIFKEAANFRVKLRTTFKRGRGWRGGKKSNREFDCETTIALHSEEDDKGVRRSFVSVPLRAWSQLKAVRSSAVLEASSLARTSSRRSSVAESKQCRRLPYN